MRSMAVVRSSSMTTSESISAAVRDLDFVEALRERLKAGNWRCGYLKLKEKGCGWRCTCSVWPASFASLGGELEKPEEVLSEKGQLKNIETRAQDAELTYFPSCSPCPTLGTVFLQLCLLD